VARQGRRHRRPWRDARLADNAGFADGAPGRWPLFSALGERSLGSILFHDPKVRRGPLDLPACAAAIRCWNGCVAPWILI
jgi:hypothetical protein